MNERQPWRTSLMWAAAICAVAGVAVAVVLQDITVLLPFVVLLLPVAGALHAVRRLPRQVMRRFAGACVALGAATISYGYFVSDDGTVQALGVLGGTALAAGGATLLAVMQVHDAHPRTCRRRPRMMRWFVALVLGAVCVYGLLWAGHTAATATCTADPPGTEIPDGSRTVDLQVAGWDCVITDDGTETARVRLGWWPHDAQTAWSQFGTTSEDTSAERHTAPAPSPSPAIEAAPVEVTVTARAASDLADIAPTAGRPYGDLLTVDEPRNLGPISCVRGPDGWWVLDAGSASLVHLDADDSTNDLRVEIPTELLVGGRYVQWYDMVVAEDGTVAAIRAALDTEGGGTSVLLHDPATGELAATRVSLSQAEILWSIGNDLVLASGDRATLLDAGTKAARDADPQPLGALPRLSDGELHLETTSGRTVTVAAVDSRQLPITGASYAAVAQDLWVLITAGNPDEPNGSKHALLTVGPDGAATDRTAVLPAAIAGLQSPVASAPELHHHSGVVSLCAFLPDGVAMWDLPAQ